MGASECAPQIRALKVGSIRNGTGSTTARRQLQRARKSSPGGEGLRQCARAKWRRKGAEIPARRTLHRGQERRELFRAGVWRVQCKFLRANSCPRQGMLKYLEMRRTPRRATHN